VPTAPAPTNTLAPTQPPPSPTTEVVPGDVQITYIYYDGQEPQVEGDEYAVIQNIGGQAVNLQGWRLNAGADGQDFNFPGYTLEPGASCRVYTNRNFPEYCGFSFNKGQALWNNGGDCGYLFDNTSAQVSSYCY
jgi:hypothetical protein